VKSSCVLEFNFA